MSFKNITSIFANEGTTNPVIDRDDIVFCTKATKGRHVKEKAVPGKYYIVTGKFENSFGTVKIFLLNEEGKEFFSTDACLERIASSKDISIPRELKPVVSSLKEGKIKWMDETYVPVFGIHTYANSGMPIVSSLDNNAVLLTSFKGDKIWVNKNVVHENDIKILMTSSFPPDTNKKGEKSEAITFRVAPWFADKKGFFGI